MAVLFLLSKERLLTCCPQRRPLLLSADELALETQPPEKEDTASLPPKSHSGGGSHELAGSRPQAEVSLVSPPSCPEGEHSAQVVKVGDKPLALLASGSKRWSTLAESRRQVDP